MQTVTVIATKDFTADDGRDVHAGEAVALVPIEAAVRGHRSEVSLDPAARATYRTRDLQAAPVPQPVVTDTTESAPATRGRRRRRSRQRQAVETT